MSALPPRGDFGVAEEDAHLFAELVYEHDAGVGAADGGGELAQPLGHEPRLEPDVGVAHVALQLGLGHHGGHAVDDDYVHGAATDEVFADFEGLLGGVRLGHQQLVHVDAAPAGVTGVQGVLGVDVGGDAAHSLGRRHYVVAEGGLAGRLGAVHLDDAALGDSADAQRYVDRDGAGRNGVHAGRAVGVSELHYGAATEVAVDLSHREFSRALFFSVVIMRYSKKLVPFRVCACGAGPADTGIIAVREVAP